MVRSIPASRMLFLTGSIVLHSWLSKRLLSLQNFPMSKCRTPCQGGSGVVETGTSGHEVSNAHEGTRALAALGSKRMASTEPVPALLASLPPGEMLRTGSDQGNPSECLKPAFKV